MNEIMRLIARIAWLFIPSWLIVYVFWIWPPRPKKYVSDESLIRREAMRLKNAAQRRRILKKFCCCCPCVERGQEYGDEYDKFNRSRSDENTNGLVHAHIQDGQHRNTIEYENEYKQNQNASLRNYQENGDEFNNQDYDSEDTYEEPSSSSNSTDSMRKSDIWDQHVITNRLSRSITHDFAQQ